MTTNPHRYVFRAELKDGQFRPAGETWQKWKQKAAEGWYSFTPRKEGLPRKLNQNNLYWLRCEVLSLDPSCNLSKQGVHEYLMRSAGYAKATEFRGELIYDRESSTQLTVQEFSYLMAEQDKLAAYFNEGREPHEYLILPTTENR